jgi:hypothetical protein
MKKILLALIVLFSAFMATAQVDKDKLALEVSKADAANTEQLKSFIWKRNSTTTVNGVVKATVLNEVSFNDSGKVVVTNISAETTVKQKPGLRGRAQESAAQDNLEYVGKALQLAMGYIYLSKGEMLDFFDKATITETAGVYTVTGQNIFVKGDKLTILIDAKTKLFISRTFSSSMGSDPVTGEVKYAKFTSGINHVTTTVLNLPVKKAVISAINQDYTKRVE